MTRTAESVVREALNLPYGDRVKVIDELLSSLDATSDDDVETAWADEIERRSEQLALGNVKSVTWDETRLAAWLRVNVAA
jgi:putative addiction module component (TIGR02574 family)